MAIQEADLSHLHASAMCIVTYRPMRRECTRLGMYCDVDTVKQIQGPCPLLFFEIIEPWTPRENSLHKKRVLDLRHPLIKSRLASGREEQ